MSKNIKNLTLIRKANKPRRALTSYIYYIIFMRFRKIKSIDVIFGYYDEVCSFSWIIITKDNPSIL